MGKFGVPGVAPPECFGQNPAFWFVLDKKMRSTTLNRNISTISPNITMSEI